MSCISLTESVFSSDIRKFLATVEYRSPKNDAEKESIYRMRYAAYRREGALPPDAPEIYKDRYDDLKNVKTIALYVGGQLASSIRLHVVRRDQPDAPSMTVFRDKLEPLVAAGATLIDPTRFVIDETAARLHPKLHYATVRIPWMAGEYYDCDYGLASVRVEHQPFYKRFFKQTVVCEARPYPSLSKPISLMLLDYRKTRPSVLERYPFLRSTEEERRGIFEVGQYAARSLETAL